jgi:hypothetical protein
MIGIYGEVYSPVVKGRGYLHNIQKFNQYSHIINAIGGFWNASISKSLRQAQAEDWYESGLGRQLIIKNHCGGVCFKGFTNLITITAGSQILTRGPLLEIANRAGCVYTPRHWGTDGRPVDGSTIKTLLVEDLPSQVSYGIIEKSTAAGACPDADAEKARDVYLLQNRLPKTTGDFSISGMGTPFSMTLELLGNIHWLTVYPYNNLNELLETVYDKLLQVIAANPNAGIFSTSNEFIDLHSMVAEQYEDKDKIALDVINEMVNLGNDINDIRRIFGVYEEDKFRYEPIPTTLSYEYYLSSQRQNVKDYNSGVMVYPWDIRPGKWIRTPDWLIGRLLESTDLRKDPRNKFIESVQFSSPYTVGITGSPYDELSQMLSKITYTGGTY